MTARILMLAATAAMLLPGNALADTLTIRLNADIRGTDGLNRDANTDVVLHHVFETLVAFRNDLSIGPLLAESWDVANDGTQYRFSLREGAVFHSGAPVTAEDVVWNWERRMDADSGWFCQPFFDGRQGLEVTDVRAEDPRTVVFDLAAPNALFLAQLANVQCNGWIASPENVDQDGVWREGVAIGSGSFALAEWDRGQSITLTRFADYQPLSEPRSGLSGDRSVLVEHLRFLIVPDTSTAETALYAGQIDIMPNLAPERMGDAEARGMSVDSAPGLAFTPMLIQTRDPMMQDARLRRALAHAIDFEALVELRSFGLARFNPSGVADASAYFDESFREWPAHDLNATRALLDEIGYNGEAIRIQTNSRYSGMYENSVLVQAMLQQAGINAELETLDWATQLDNYLAGRFQMQSFGYSPRLDPAQLYGILLGNKDDRPTIQWENDEAYALYLQTMQTTDFDERQSLFRQIHALMAQDVPLLGIYYEPETGAARPHVQGYEVWPGGLTRGWGVSVGG